MQKLFIATIVCFLTYNCAWAGDEEEGERSALLDSADIFKRGHVISSEDKKYSGALIESDEKKNGDRIILLSQLQTKFCGQDMYKEMILLMAKNKKHLPAVTWSETTPFGNLLTIACAITGTAAITAAAMLCKIS